MVKRARPSWDRLLSGMQIGVFEIIWSSFRWIKGIWIRRSAGRVYFHIQTTDGLNGKEKEAFRDQIEALTNVAKGFDKASFRAGFTIRYSPRRVPRGMGYRIVMSDRVFREIARRRAPWRLDDGR